MSEPWPKEITLTDDKTTLIVNFEDGETHKLSAEYLRTHSGSAEVKGHAKDQEVLVTDKKEVKIAELSMTGNYALKITFSDGHDTGLYTWPYLHELGENKETYWQTYLEKLEACGKTR